MNNLVRSIIGYQRKMLHVQYGYEVMERMSDEVEGRLKTSEQQQDGGKK